MALLIRQPWAEQPQEAVGVDWGNPLAQGLVYHVNHAIGPRDLVGPPGAVTDVGTIGAGSGSGRYGAARGISGSGAGRSITNPNDALRINSGGVTHAGLVRITSIDGNFGAVFAVSDAAGNATFGLQRDGTSNDVYLFRGNVNGQRINGSPLAVLADGKQHLFVAISEGVTSEPGSLWIDGVKYASFSSGAPGTQAGAGVSIRFFLERASSPSFGSDGDYYQHWAWNRALTDAEALAFTERPQRTFEPRRIWVPVAAGGGPATFDASVSGTASTSAALTTAIRLAGSVNGSASVAAPLTTAIRFAVSFNATASTSAALTTAIRAAASVTGTATATGTLTTAIRFAGSVAGSATVSANLSAGGGVAASVSASATATAALTTSIRLAAAVSAQATASAALTTAIRLASAVSGSATTTAALTATSGGVAAAVTASASATASLTTAVRMAAIANASASASAALAGSIAVTTGSVVYIPIRALTGLWTTAIPAESDLANLRAWLPPQRVQLVDANGVMRAEWYRFFHFLAEKKLGGATSPTIPEIATSLTSAVDQSAAASLAASSLTQQVTQNADSLDVTVQVAKNNNLIGAGSIPPVQRSTQQSQ